MAQQYVTMMFHPTSTVDDLELAREWYLRVFGRRGITWEERWDFSKMKPDYPKDYSFLVHLGDVNFDVLSPSVILAKTGHEPMYPKGEGLADMAWYAEQVPALARKILGGGFRIIDQAREQLVDGPDLEAQLESSLTSDSDLFWVDGSDAGIPYEFFDLGQEHREFYSRIGDPRLNPSWVLPPTEESDPLGVIRSSHHTVVTGAASRGVELYVDVLGGIVVDQRESERWQGESTFVSFAESVIEFVRLREGAPQDPRTGQDAAGDIYAGITLQVQDIEKVRRHLAEQGLTLAPADRGIRTLPAETFGVEWGFSLEAAPRS